MHTGVGKELNEILMEAKQSQRDVPWEPDLLIQRQRVPDTPVILHA